MVSRVYGPIWHLAHDQPLMTRRGRFVKMYAGQHVVPRIALIEMTDLQDGPDRFLQILAFIKQAVWRPASRRWADGEEGLSRARRSRQVLRFGLRTKRLGRCLSEIVRQRASGSTCRTSCVGFARTLPTLATGDERPSIQRICERERGCRRQARPHARRDGLGPPRLP